MQHAVKLMQETDSSYVVGGYGVVWNGRDISGQWFDKSSDLWLDRINGNPMLMFDHGFDPTIGKAVLGHVVTKTVDDAGLWIEGQIDKASQYAEMVMELVRKGVLGFSTGSAPHLVEVTKTGYIKSWPIFETSFTTTPCEPRTVGVDDLTAIGEANPDFKSFIDHVKALPAGPTAVDGHGSYPDGSYEALMGILQKSVSRLLVEPDEYDSWCYIVATFPGYVVACVCEGMGEEMAYYEVEYKLDRAGMPTLGKSRRVERRYVPIETPPADMAATATMSAYTVRSATALAARVRVLHEGRVKEGRVLSQTNRERVRDTHAALVKAAEAYATLLTDTEPKTRAEVGTTKATVEVQAAHARILALASGLEILP